MKHGAFTLIELLIVISIIGILAAAIVLNFSGTRERQQLALLEDKSVAMLQVAASEVRAGKINPSDGSYFCEGAYFAQDEEPYFVRMDYDSTSGTCDYSTVEEEDYGLKTNPAVVSTIAVGDVSGIVELYALYVPPEADLYLTNSTGTVYSGEGVLSFYTGSGDDSTTVLKLSTLTNKAALSLTTAE